MFDLFQFVKHVLQKTQKMISWINRVVVTCVKQKLSETDAEEDKKRVEQERGVCMRKHAQVMLSELVFAYFFYNSRDVLLLYPLWPAGVGAGLHIDDSSKTVGLFIGKELLAAG